MSEQTATVTSYSPAPAEKRRPLVKRGALVTTFDPPQFLWNGKRVPLSPLEADIMALLVVRGRASWEELGRLFERRSARISSLEVLVYRIRRKFAAIGASDPIDTIRGWGLRIQVDTDTQGSRTLWIGASEFMN